MTTSRQKHYYGLTSCDGGITLPGSTTNQSLVYNGTTYVPAYNNGPVYNVMDHGLIGDGSTPNDTAFAALMALVTITPGARVVFPRGNYVFHNTVTTPQFVSFESLEQGYYTTITYAPLSDPQWPGTFWIANSNQEYNNLSFTTTYSPAWVSNPGRQNIIINVTNTSPIIVTTATDHGYLNNYRVSLYGITGCLAANNDPANPWCIQAVTNNTFALYFQTTISLLSDGITLPQATIHVSSTLQLPSSGTALITTSAGQQTVTYLGLGSHSYGNNADTNVTLIGCSGGTGTMSYGGQVLIASDGDGVFTPQTMAVTTMSGNGVSPIQVTVANTAGLQNSGLVFISGETGNTNANGLCRIAGVSLSTPTTFSLFSPNNYPNTTTTGNGSHSGSATITYGSCCVCCTGVPIVGLSLQAHFDVNGLPGGSNITVNHCNSSGFKYPFAIDGQENIKLIDCTVGIMYATCAGYNEGLQVNDSTHSAAGMWLGTLTTWPWSQYTNVITIDRTNNLFYYIGTLHHDGVTHTVRDCNYEQRVIAAVCPSDAVSGVKIINPTTDGSDDNRGVIWVHNDNHVVGPSFSNLVLEKGNASSWVGAPCIANDLGNALEGVYISAFDWQSTGDVLTNGAADPVIIQSTIAAGALCSNSAIMTPNAPTGGIAGTTINHYMNPAASLDVACLPVPNTEVPLEQWCFISPNFVNNRLTYHYKSLTVDSTGVGGGWMQEYDDVLSEYANPFSYSGARHGRGMGWALVPINSASQTTALTNIPSYYASGILRMCAQAAVSENETISAMWQTEQRYTKSAITGLVILGSIDSSTVYDNIGLTMPALFITGTIPTNQLQATVYPYVFHTTIAAGSDGQAIPQSTVYVASTTGAPASGTLTIMSSNGLANMTYTSVTGGGTPSFNGCTFQFPLYGSLLATGQPVGLQIEYSVRFEFDQDSFF